jgi:hypothetical protein
MADTIREFLAGLGFRVDEASERRFTAALEGATLRAKILGDALEAMAKTVADKIAGVAESFEQLYYESQRIGSSAQSIKAFEYAVSQLGGTVEGAHSSLESFGRMMRDTPGFRGWIKQQFGVETEGRDAADILGDVLNRMNKMAPALQAQWRTLLGVDERTQFAARDHDAFLKRYGESLRSQGEAGIGGPAFANAAKFEQAWREVWQRIGNMAEGGESKLFSALTRPMEKLNAYLNDHEAEIDAAIGKVATALGDMATKWEKAFEGVKWGDLPAQIDGFANSMVGLIKKFSDFAGELGKVESGLEKIVAWLNYLAGVDGAKNPMSPHIGPDGQMDILDPNGGGGWLGRQWERAKGWLGLGGGGAGGGGTVSPPVGPLRDRALSLMNFLVTKRGWTPAAAAIAAGNAEQESGINPAGPPGDGGISWGMFQWNRDRLERLKARFGSQWQSKEAQYEFMADEAERMVPGWKSQPDLRNAGEIGYRYEGYGDNSTATRVANAQKWLETYERYKAGASVPGNDPGVMLPSSPAFGYPALNINPGALKPNYPVPSAGGGAGEKQSINSTVNNHITVAGPDPHTAAAMVALHLDRTSADLARNLQGAIA